MNITEQNERLLQLYARARAMHTEIMVLNDAVCTHCKQEGTSGPVVDAVYLLKKTKDFVEGSRKELNKGLELLQKLGCLFAMHTPNNSLRGEIASGFGSSSQQMLIPDRDKDPEKYAMLMNAIGVPNIRVARPSFTGVEEFMTQLAKDGKPLPAGLEQFQTVDKFTITARAVSGVDIDKMANEVMGDATEPVLDEDNPF